jgi:hypothetical protein
MSINKYALRVAPDQRIGEACEGYQFASLDDYRKEVDDFSEGSVLFVPTYRLEEVEEVIEPEKRGVPVEPYVGLEWVLEGSRRVIIEVNSEWAAIAIKRLHGWDVEHHVASDLKLFSGYPRTPSTPAVTRKVKKWVKIEHPEVPEE